MEEEKKLIFSLEFDTEAALKRSADFRHAIDADKKALAELNKEINTIGPVNKEQLLQREQLEKKIRENTRARADEIKAVDTYIKATKDAVGADGKLKNTREQQMAALSFLTKKWSELTEEQRENTEQGKALAAEIKNISDSLKGMEKGVGMTYRNVGNYSEGLKDAIEQSGFLSGVTLQVRDAQQKLVSTLNIVKAGLGGNISMLKLFRLALLGTGIGAVVLLLGGLVSYLTKTQRGIDFVERKTKALTTILGVLTDKLSGVGESLFNAFDNPKQALIDFVKFIETNLLNRAKSLLVIFDAIKNRDFNKLQDGVFQLATGVTDATSKAKALVKELSDVAKTAEAIEKENQRIRDAERALNVERDRSRAKIKELNKLAEDTTKTTAQRAKAAKEAMDIEIALDIRRRSLQEARIKNLKAEQKLTESLTADNQALADEESKLYQMEAESLELRTTLQNKYNTIIKEGVAIQKALVEARKKALLDDLKTFQDAITAVQEAAKKQLEDEKKIKEERQKVIDKQFQNSEKARKDAQEQREKEQAQLDKDAQAEIDRKQKVYNATVDFATASEQLMGVLANENAQLAEFQKGLALFRIGLASAEAITKGIAASQDVPFPGNLLAMGAVIASVTANLIQAKQMIIDPPKKKFADGGVLEGPSHAEGGIQIYSKSGYHYGEAEGGEPILTAGVSKNPALLAIASMINQAAGGKPLAPARYMAAGGLVTSAARNASVSAPQIDYNKLAKAISQQPIYVIPTEIRDKANSADARKARAGIGA